ncbi:regulatory Fis family protein [Cytobacillus firmus]|uniref:Regulatory Fis family protein n=2 Tax=Cytobacillus TaxID=2675230 RepID=A0A366K4L7_CYTFI|nr:MULTISPECIES: CoA transferase [Cytobacillus]RBP96078.1 regulatory Fis family protein [Cytobacillus firmus]TDX44991.1 regulatory Fis family protein [Cytobacillus oceanisediminis]
MKFEKPLSGLKVLEMGQLIAGPFTTRMLAEFGAEVIKVEPPGKGDPIRKWRYIYKGSSLWWKVQSRNKKSITINLKSEEGQRIIKELVRSCDIVVENFRPGVESDYIRTILNHCNGDKETAAKKLGISKTTLWRKLKQ